MGLPDPDRRLPSSEAFSCERSRVAAAVAPVATTPVACAQPVCSRAGLPQPHRTSALSPDPTASCRPRARHTCVRADDRAPPRRCASSSRRSSVLRCWTFARSYDSRASRWRRSCSRAGTAPGSRPSSLVTVRASRPCASRRRSAADLAVRSAPPVRSASSATSARTRSAPRSWRSNCATRVGGIDGVGGIDSVAFMGMGEALANPHTFTALQMLTHPDLYAMSPRRLTVSTVGFAPGLQRLVDTHPTVNVTLSVHSPYADERAELIPLQRRFPLSDVPGHPRHPRDRYPAQDLSGLPADRPPERQRRSRRGTRPHDQPAQSTGAVPCQRDSVQRRGGRQPGVPATTSRPGARVSCAN